MTVHHSAAQRSILPRVLIAANDPHIAVDLEELLASEGFAVIGPTPTVETTLRLLAVQKPDLVVLDSDLSGKPATPVAETLHDCGIPFVVTTGSCGSTTTIETQTGPFAGVVSFTKPAPAEQLIECLNQLFQEKMLSLVRAI
jgi:DNA-binding NarL/FixJ family response regulator